jgi:hypothetical protein
MWKKLALFAGITLSSLAAAQPLTSEFTYQARLTSAGSPAAGPHDLRFRLYDAAAGGTQVGPTLCADNVTVADGMLTVSLDFGGQFEGQQRFLEVEVRAESGLECSNLDGFTILSPRQVLSAVPNAAFALTSASATNATTAISATTAANASQLNGQPAAFYTNAANLTGTVPAGLLEGTYTGPLALSNAANSFSGSGAGLTGLSASNIGSGTLAQARLPNPLSLSGADATGTLVGQNAATSNSAAGVYGRATGASGATLGVFGLADSPDGNGVQGIHSATSGAGAGVVGITNSTTFSGSGSGVLGIHNGMGILAAGVRGNGPFGVVGAGGTGVYGTGNTGVIGESTSTNQFGSDGGSFSSTANMNGRGVYARGSRYGVYAENNFGPGGTGVYGESNGTTGSGFGLRGKCSSPDGTGVFGENPATSGTAYGVHGTTGSGSTGAAAVFGHATATSGNAVGVHGLSAGSGPGVLGRGTGSLSYGVIGSADGSSGRGVEGHGFIGVLGNTNSSSGYGVFGDGLGAPYGVYAAGGLGASGTKSFRIDHPSDPENTYLVHYCSEAPQPQNFYNGIVTLDEAGESVVSLPGYFAAINKDPRYTLTALGAAMPMLHIADEVSADSLSTGAHVDAGQPIPPCSFRIAGGAPGGRVSWEVKALRNDRWIQQHGAPIEVQKQAPERGTYQHPELYGLPADRGMLQSHRSAPQPAPPVSSSAQ